MKVSRQQGPDCVIQVEGLAKSFGAVEAVVDLSFEVYRGEIFGFLGPNGAGKTTTLNILEGLRQVDEGCAVVLGMDVERSAAAIKRRIGVQLQSTSLLPDLTVYEQVQLFAHLYGCRPAAGDILALLERVGLAEKEAALPENLSGGQQQRLSLALALVNRPEIIFLDEPTTGLDPQSRRALWQIIRELRSQGKTIVLTTHYMEEAETLCDRVAIIDRGRLVALDTPRALVQKVTDLSSITTSASLPLDDARAHPCITAVHREGAHLHLQTADVPQTLRIVLDLAEQHGLRLYELQVKQPNLEDVFLNLTGHNIRA